MSKHTITAEVLSDGDKAWYGVEVMLETKHESGWFPTGDVFALNGRKYVAPDFAKSLKLSGNMGSRSVGCSVADLPKVTKALEVKGHKVVRE
jgi:hypothetical protein